jgi:hypothetical protein
MKMKMKSKMKRIILTLATVAFISAGVNAQVKFGIKAGWNFQDFDISNNVGEQLKKDNVVSWDLGVVAQLHLSGAFYLQPELVYSTQKVELTTETLEKSKISYFQVPVHLLYKYKPTDLFGVFVSGGAYFGYAVDRTGFSVSNLRKTDWGVSLGAGVEVWKLQLHAKYNWALQNISDVTDIKWKNNRFNVSLALFIL